jgi:hypothetical protein
MPSFGPYAGKSGKQRGSIAMIKQPPVTLAEFTRLQFPAPGDENACPTDAADHHALTVVLAMSMAGLTASPCGLPSEAKANIDGRLTSDRRV